MSGRVAGSADPFLRTAAAGTRALPAAAGLAVLVGALASPDAGAVDAVRYDYRGAAGICAPALPVHGQSLRARPLGLTNEGNADSFVTCTFFGTGVAGRSTEHIAVVVANAGPTATTVTCTLVDEFASGSASTATYWPKTSSLLITGNYSTLEWLPASAGAPATITRAAVQCRLPPRTTLHYIWTRYWEDVAG